ncbi:MAG: hypothetical protein B6I24_03150 [Bacteroidetes bacterium 4572_128]|nr:MAG: hypothetical protein B6I24_03150 [Bacteroidetes bacterium 4572_128]
MNLKNNFSTDIAKKKFGNKNNAYLFLFELKIKNYIDLPIKTITRGKNKGEKILDLNTNQIWAKIVNNYELYRFKKIIIRIFRKLYL